MSETPKKTIKRKTVETIATGKTSELVKQLTNDNKLKEDSQKLQLYMTLANFYEEDLKNNLFLTSFELDDKYATYNYYAWSEFKQYPLVRNYTENFLHEMNLAEAQKTINFGGVTRTSDAMALQEMVEGKRMADKNTNVIVFLMPQRNYKKVD